MPATKDNGIPTAPIGLTVIWKVKGKNPVGTSAICERQESPGIIALRTLDSKHSLTSGVLYAGHPEAQNDKSIRVKTQGIWDYIEGEQPKKSHYALYEQKLKADKERAERAEREQKAREEQWAKEQEDREKQGNNLLETTRIQQQTAAHMAQ